MSAALFWVGGGGWALFWVGGCRWALFWVGGSEWALFWVGGALFCVGGGGWALFWVGGGGWGWVNCLIMPISVCNWRKLSTTIFTSFCFIRGNTFETSFTTSVISIIKKLSLDQSE